MLVWKAQGAAYAADVQLLDGRAAKAIVVAARSNPRGLAIVVPSPDGALQNLLSPAEYEAISAGDLIEILATQERAFGESGLPKPDVAS